MTALRRAISVPNDQRPLSYIITEEEAVERRWSITDDREGLWTRLPGYGNLMLNVPLCSCCDQPVDEHGACEDCGLTDCCPDLLGREE